MSQLTRAASCDKGGVLFPERKTIMDRMERRLQVCRPLVFGEPIETIARETGLSKWAIFMTAQNARIYPPNNASNKDMDIARRNREICRCYLSGKTLSAIGGEYSLSRERVRQIIRRVGISAEDGGQAIRRRKAEKEKGISMTRGLGCTPEQRAELLNIGKEMMERGISKYKTPIFAFRTQRQAAKRRGIGWELTLWEWWTIWLSSGKFPERGPGKGYAMCRRGDKGPYAKWNVFIQRGLQNTSDAQLGRPRAKNSRHRPCNKG